MILSLLLLSPVTQAQTITEKAQLLNLQNGVGVSFVLRWNPGSNAAQVAKSTKSELESVKGMIRGYANLNQNWSAILSGTATYVTNIEKTIQQIFGHADGRFEIDVIDTGQGIVFLFLNLDSRDSFMIDIRDPRTVYWSMANQKGVTIPFKH